MAIIEDITTDIDGNKLKFKNDPMLRPAEVKIGLTEEHIKEYLKCKNDIVYFAENYIYIMDPDLGRSKIQIWDFQKKLLEHYANNRFSIVMASRQIGKCVYFFTKIKIRNIKTGKIKTEFIGLFYLKQKIKLKIKKFLSKFI